MLASAIWKSTLLPTYSFVRIFKLGMVSPTLTRSLLDYASMIEKFESAVVAAKDDSLQV
jgi:hypothetical protein